VSFFRLFIKKKKVLILGNQDHLNSYLLPQNRLEAKPSPSLRGCEPLPSGGKKSTIAPFCVDQEERNEQLFRQQNHQ
jgi:hypothetical protein